MKIITITELRSALPKTLRRVRSSKQPIALTLYSELVAFLVLPTTELPIERSTSVSSVDFRIQLTTLLESFWDGVDAIEVYSHDRKVALLISPKFADRFPPLNLPSVLD